jgi:hypothetical protein
MSLPRFSNPRLFNSLPLLPPFYFENMTTRVFPLRSSIASLQNLLNRYLNDIPPEVGRFRALVPYTFLMMIDYGKLAAQAANLGWLAQREVMFAVPVGHYKLVGGKWEFVGIVWATPFIFVDSDIALTLGRQVYGWPKLLQHLTPTVSDWMEDPRAPVQAATLSTPVFSKLYTGGEQVPQTYLEVLYSAPSLQAQIPFDLKDPFLPWNISANLAKTASEGVWDALGALRGLGIAPPTAYGGANLGAGMDAVMSAMQDPGVPDLKFNTLNFKQFRDSAHPEMYCYQAMTAANMIIKSFNRGGMLGDASILAGDASGGYSIRLHKWPSLPIVDTLGLEVAREWRGDGVDVVELDPVRPFWYDVDMSYERGRNLCWRSFDRVWHDEDGGTYLKPPMGGDTKEVSELKDRLYNTTLGSALQTVTGPFEFTDSTMRVLPLLADRATLQDFLDQYLNTPLSSKEDPDVRFELWSSKETSRAYVYLIITSFGDISSATDNIGNWATEDAAFFIPVKWYEGDELRGIGLVPVFTYVGDTTSAISDTEVLGWPTTKGTFFHPQTTWMQDPQDGARSSVLRVEAEIIPSLAEGQEAVQRAVLEVVKGTLELAKDADRLADQWSDALREEIQRKNRTHYENPADLMSARALSLELVAKGRPINIFTMKQFRDVFEPERACYQSIVRIPRTIQHVHDMRAFKEPLSVRVQEYPSQPIVSLLGLEATLTGEQGGGQDFIMFPVRPFWVRLAWKEDLGQQMWYRTDEEWKTREPPSGEEWRPFFDPASTDAPTVTRSLVERIDDGDPARAKDVVNDPPARHARVGLPISIEDARRAVEAIDPQMVLDTICAHEWGNADPNSRWRERRSTLDRRRRRVLQGIPRHERAGVENSFFKAETKRLSKPRLARFQPWVIASAEEKIRMLEALANSRGQIEASYDAESAAKARALLMAAAAGLAVEGTVTYPPPDTHQVEMLEEALEYLLEDDDFDEEWAERRDVDDSAFRAVVQTARAAYRCQRDAVLATLAKASQEPNYSVPRDILGREWNHLFPRRDSWKKFYVGADPARSPKKRNC